MKYRQKKRFDKKDAVKAVVVLVVLVCLLVCGGLALHLWENGQYSTGSDEVGSEVIATSDELKEVTYNGQTWQQRPELETYLLMGIDKEGKAVAVDSYEGGGQADVQIVLVVDNADQTW